MPAKPSIRPQSVTWKRASSVSRSEMGDVGSCSGASCGFPVPRRGSEIEAVGLVGAPRRPRAGARSRGCGRRSATLPSGAFHARLRVSRTPQPSPPASRSFWRCRFICRSSRSRRLKAAEQRGHAWSPLVWLRACRWRCSARVNRFSQPAWEHANFLSSPDADDVRVPEPDPEPMPLGRCSCSLRAGFSILAVFCFCSSYFRS